jgi:DnaJ-domain-containing protein 1
MTPLLVPFLLLACSGRFASSSPDKGSLFNWDNLWQSQSYYDVLKVDEKASVKEIKKAYRRMAVLMHPDKLDIKTDEEKVSV